MCYTSTIIHTCYGGTKTLRNAFYHHLFVKSRNGRFLFSLSVSGIVDLLVRCEGRICAVFYGPPAKFLHSTLSDFWQLPPAIKTAVCEIQTA